MKHARLYTAELAKFVFGEPMKACPTCQGYQIGYSVPIKLDGPLPEDAEGMLQAWAKARKGGHTALQGTARIMCRRCGHLGPAVDVTGRTAEEVTQDKGVAAEVRKLWNEQPEVSRI